jgi:hypothetical protein
VAEDNPYTPPAAPVRDIAPAATRSPALCILAGLVVDVVGTIVSRTALLAVYVTPTLDVGEASRALSRPLSVVFLAIVVLGVAFSALGGYVCARMARRDERRITAVLAAVRSVIGLPMFITNDAWVSIAVLTLTFVSVMAGGGLGRYRNLAEKRKTAAAILA